MKTTAMGKLTSNDALSCSQLPALLGVDAYGKTPNDVLRRCIDAINGVEDDFQTNEAMNWGSLLEKQILEVAADRLGMELQHGFTEAFVAKDIPLQCSLDGRVWKRPNATIPTDPADATITTNPGAGIYVLTNDGTISVTGMGILEAKLTSYAPEDSPPLHRGPLQLQGQMICTGATWGAIATLYRGTEMRIFVFARHEGTVDRITRAAFDFQARLDTYRNTGIAEYYPLASPEDGSRTFPEIKRPVAVDLGDEAAELVATIKACDDVIKGAEDQKARITATLMDMIGDAEAGRAGRWLVNWGSRSYKAQPEKVVPAKDAYTVRNKTLLIKEVA
jgi:predicted phage-related endonuclease